MEAWTSPRVRLKYSPLVVSPYTDTLDGQPHEIRGACVALPS
jgi:hypothetical protein